MCGDRSCVLIWRTYHRIGGEFGASLGGGKAGEIEQTDVKAFSNVRVSKGGRVLVEMG